MRCIMPGASVCPVALSCRELPFSESPIVARLAADRCSRAALDGAVPDSHPDGSRTPRWSPYLRRWPLDWRERAPTPASGSCVSIPCPPESGPSASDLRGPDDRIVSSKRDVRVFHKGNFPSSRFLLIYLDVSCLDASRTSFPGPLSIRHCWSRELFVSRFRYYYVLRLLPVHHFPLRFRL